MIEITNEPRNNLDACGNKAVASLEINGTSIDLCFECLNELKNALEKFNSKKRCHECNDFIMSSSGWDYGGSCKRMAADNNDSVSIIDAGYNYSVSCMDECKYNHYNGGDEVNNNENDFSNLVLNKIPEFMAKKIREDTIDEFVNKMKKFYFDSELQSAKDDPCVIDAMIDLAIRTAESMKDTQESTNKSSSDSYEIFILTKSGYEYYKELIPRVNCAWWLRPDEYDDITDCSYAVTPFGTVKTSMICDEFGVRPVLRCKNENYKIGERIILLEFPWIYIGDNLLIAEVPVDFSMYTVPLSYTGYSNDYEKSDIKECLNKWVQKRI